MTFYYGSDYYPEQWPESRWLEDARLMQEAGFNVVRIGEFAWAKMEPNEGRCPDAGLGSPFQPKHLRPVGHVTFGRVWSYPIRAFGVQREIPPHQLILTFP